MTRTIVQTEEFDAPPTALFALYVESAKHSEATGGAAKMSKKAGAKYSAWDGYITGVNVAIVPGRLVVQTWRAADWGEGDADSTLVLAFSATGTGGRVDMVHAGVPDDQADALDDGWRDNYWNPWRAYLASRAKGGKSESAKRSRFSRP